MLSTPYLFHWSGSQEQFLDTPTVQTVGHVAVGLYGGNTAAGAKKNEDAALVWTASDASWVFAALLDAHGSSESADLVLNRVAELQDKVIALLGSSDTGECFSTLSTLVVDHFNDTGFRRACATIRGETALLLCAQKNGYLWWLSVGDIPVYVFHPEFAHLGQFALNQRMFFEWVGQVNMFALPVPCYASGVRQLRPGVSHILLTTDGLLEYGDRRFEDPHLLRDHFAPSSARPVMEDLVLRALEQVHTGRGRDNATLIAWEVKTADSDEVMQPSA